MKNRHETKICLNGYSVRTGSLHGRSHMIVPAVLLVPGSHCGSGGPMLYTPEVLSKHASSWNSRVLTIDHPQLNGEYVSASATPDIHQRVSIGSIWNARYENERLKADLWIDQAKAPAQLLAALREGKPLELSTGLFSNDLYESGVWNGQEYEAVVENLIPDHCAIFMPGSGTVGACSVQAGCGIRSNQSTCKKTNKNTNLEEYQDMEETLETPRFFWDAPRAVQIRLKEHFAANIGHEAAENRTHQMTMQEAIEMDRSLRGCAGSKGNCGGCGTCGDPQVIVNDDDEETPLGLPLMNFEPERPRIDNSDEGEEETPMETPVMTFEKR